MADQELSEMGAKGGIEARRVCLPRVTRVACIYAYPGGLSVSGVWI